jgi:MFS family permease
VDGKRGLTIGVYNSVLAMGFAAGPLILSLTGIGTIAPYAAGIAIYAVAAAPVVIGARYAPVLDSAPSFALTKIVRQAPSSTLAAFVFGAIEAGAFSLLVIYALRIGMLPPAPTILIAVVALGNVIFQVPIGYLGDIIDRRLLLVFCAVIGAAGALALPFVAFNPWVLYPVAAAWGGIIVGLYTLGLTHLGSQYKGPELAAASSAFVLLYSLGSLVGPLTLGFGIDIWDPHGYIVVLVLVFCLFAILVATRWLRAPAFLLNPDNNNAG